MVENASYLGCWYTNEITNTSYQGMCAVNLALSIFTGFTALFTVLANAFVIYIYAKSRAKQPISNTLLLLMAIFDLIQGLFSQPLFVLTRILELHKIFNCSLQIATKTLSIIFGCFSFILVTLVMTSERLFAIVLPIRHRVVMRKRLIVTSSLSLFVFWTVLVLLMQHVWRAHFALEVIIMIKVSFGLVYTLVVYIKIYSIIRKLGSFVDGRNSPGSHLKTAKRTPNSSRSNPSKETEIQMSPALAKNTKLGDENCTIIENRNAQNCEKDFAKGSEKKQDIRFSDKAIEVEDNSCTKQERSWNSMQKQGLSLPNDDDDASIREKCKVQVSKWTPANKGGTKIKSNMGRAQSCSRTTKSKETDDKNAVEFTTNSRSESNHECLWAKAASVCKKKFGSTQQSVAKNGCTLTPQEKKTVCRMICIVGALYFCHLPVMLFFVYVDRDGVDVTFVKYIYPWIMAFASLTSVLNPFIYCYSNDHFWSRAPCQGKTSGSSS